GANQVFGVHCPTEKLESVISSAVSFNVFDSRAAADGGKGKAVEFLVGCQHCSTMTDGDIAHDARVVVVIRAAIAEHILTVEREIRVEPFKGFIARVGDIADVVHSTVDRGVAKEHDSAPMSARVWTP